MKAILISIHPQWVELILSLIKKDEIRKGTAIGKAITRLIKEQGVAPMLIYCTKGKENLWRHNDLHTFGKLSKDIEKQFCAYGKNRKELDDKLLDFLRENGIKESISRAVDATLLNGKVVARFNATADLLELKMIEGGLYFTTPDRDCFTPNLDLNENAQIDNWQLLDYTGEKLGTQISDIHINDLEIFDRPRKLCEFHKNVKKEPPEELLCPECGKPMEYYEYKYLTKAPQSWCYVEIEK